MDDDEGIDEAIAIIVIGREINGRIGGDEGVERHGLGIGGDTAHARRAMGVGGKRLRQPERADDIALDVDQPVGDLLIIVANAFFGAAGGKEQVAEMLLGRRHRLVAEIDEHDDDPQGATQRRAIGAGRADDAGRGAEREFLGRDDDTVVEAERARLRHSDHHRFIAAQAVLGSFQRLVEFFAVFRRHGDGTAVAVIAIAGGGKDIERIGNEILIGHHNSPLKRLLRRDSFSFEIRIHCGGSQYRNRHDRGIDLKALRNT